DRLDAALDELAVGGRPVCRDLRDRGQAVTREPLSRDLAGRHLTREYNLEGPLAGLDARHGIGRCTQIVVEEAVEAVAVPIKLLLQSNHSTCNGRMPIARLTERLLSGSLSCRKSTGHQGRILSREG